MTGNEVVKPGPGTYTEMEAAIFFSAPEEARPYVLEMIDAHREREDRPTDVEFMVAFVDLVATSFAVPSFDDICAHFGGIENTHKLVRMSCEARLHEVRTGMPARAVVRKVEDGYELILVKCREQITRTPS